jgi:hypothetical protein
MQLRPISYRAEIIGPMLTSIAAGECCSIIGMSGVGKSNLIQHLLRPDVQRHYLAESAGELQFVVFDTNMLAEWSPWGVFEGLAEALLALPGPDLEPELAERIRLAHSHALGAVGNYAAALRECAAALALLCERQRTVVLFDEFDPLFSQLPGSVLRNLRGLRDRHKYRLIYLTFSRQPLPDLRDDDEWDDIEPFVELLSLRELGLGPLRDADAADEVDRFAARHARTLEHRLREQIVTQSGGHPALVRALTQQTLLVQGNPGALGKDLHTIPALRLECTKIWQQLSGDEQDTLALAAHNRSVVGRLAHMLSLKGLLRVATGGTPVVFSPLFTAFVQTIGTSPAGAPEPIQIDPTRRVVHYYGRDISGEITPLEYQLLLYLWEHLNEVCPVADVAAAVYAGEQHVYDNEISEYERVRTLARRLRQHLEQLEPDQPMPFTIFRKRGYRLGIPLVE